MHRQGKARTRYEFGVKASIAVINSQTKHTVPPRGPGDKPVVLGGGQFVVGAMALPGFPYDGHTIKNQIDQIQRLTGVEVERVYVDKGYRGHGLKDPDLEIYISQTRGIASPTIKRATAPKRH